MSPRRQAGRQWVTDANGDYIRHSTRYLLPGPCLEGTGNLAASQIPATIITTLIKPFLPGQGSNVPVSGRATSHPQKSQPCSETESSQLEKMEGSHLLLQSVWDTAAPGSGESSRRATDSLALAKLPVKTHQPG